MVKPDSTKFRRVKQPNPVRIEGESAFLTLFRRDGNNVECRIDTTDLPKVQSVPRRWHSVWNKGTQTFYVMTADGPRNAKVYTLLHRFLLDPPADMEVDHINRNALDNRRANLRSVTRSQNIQNQRTAKSGSASGIRNVYYRPKRGTYVVSLRVDGKQKHIGEYRDLGDAEAAATTARRNYFTHCPENSPVAAG